MTGLTTFTAIVNGGTKTLAAGQDANGTLAPGHMLTDPNAAPLGVGGNPIISSDAQAISNLGSILAQGVTEIANQGSQIAQGTTMIAQMGSVIANLGSLVAGVLTKDASRNIVALDGTVVAAAGTPAVALSAGHATAGGILRTVNAAGFFVAQIGNAGTVDGGNTYFVAANTPYDVIPTTGSVSINAAVSGVIVAGNGFE